METTEDVKKMALLLSPPDFINFCFNNIKNSRILFKDISFWKNKLEKDYPYYKTVKFTTSKSKSMQLPKIRLPILPKHNSEINIAEINISENKTSEKIAEINYQDLYLKIFNKHISIIQNILPFSDKDLTNNYYKAWLEIQAFSLAPCNLASINSSINANRYELKRLCDKYKISLNIFILVQNSLL